MTQFEKNMEGIFNLPETKKDTEVAVAKKVEPTKEDSEADIDYKYARENLIPFMGICLGMQLSVIEFARNTLKIKNAGSSELDKKCFPIVGLLNEWNKNGKLVKGTNKELGGTMRLGAYEAKLRHNSLIERIYNK